MKAIIELIKESKWKTIIISCLLIVLTFSISYAAFYKGGEGTLQSGNIGKVDITYTDGDTFNFVNSMPLLEEEVIEYAPSYSFSVKNTGNINEYIEISFSELVIDEDLKKDSNFRFAVYEDLSPNAENLIAEGNFQNATTKISLKKNILIGAKITKTYIIRVWINDNGGDQNALLNKSMSGKINVTATDKVVATTFDYSGTIDTFTVEETGNYIIEAAGASGTTGNTHSFTGTPPTGGKGATISSTFALNSGDVLYIVSGGKGSITDALLQDGTSGAGGGGSFVFKKISSITNSTYQFQKGSDYYEVLLVAAGGGGANDASEASTATNGSNGIGATWISVGGTAYSTQTATTNSTSLSSVLGISQFISYNLAGGTFTKNSGICTGGFGGGGCSDNNPSYGGGWSTGTSYAATSFSSGTNTSGTTGSRTGNGYVSIYKD